MMEPREYLNYSQSKFGPLEFFLFQMMELKGMTFDHDFYVVVGKQCRTENAYAGHQHNIFIQIN